MTNPEPDTPPVPTSFLPQAGDQPGVRALKIVVLSLGVLLAVGMLVMIGRIGYMLANPTPTGQNPATSNSQPAKIDVPRQDDMANTSNAANAVTIPAKGVLILPKGGAVTNMALSGDRLAVHYTSPQGTIIVIIDLKTGREIQRLEVQQP